VGVGVGGWVVGGGRGWMCACVPVCLCACGVCVCACVCVCVCVFVHIYMHTHSVLHIVWCCGLVQFSSTNYYEQTHSLLHIVWCCGLVRGAVALQAQAAAADLDQIPLNDVLAKCRKLQADFKNTEKIKKWQNVACCRETSLHFGLKWCTARGFSCL
jgi:hypothetical protein